MNMKEIYELIYFLLNSIKENNNENINKGEEALMEICSPDQNTFLLVGEVLADIIFDPTLENDLHMLSVIILYRYQILRTELIISNFVDRIIQTNIYDENFPILKNLCLAIASVIEPTQINSILNYQPSYSILFILYYYVHENEKDDIDSNALYNYIIKYSLIDPSKGNIEISTITCGILSNLRVDDDDSYDELITTFFSQLPAEIEYLPIFCELKGALDQIPDSNEKISIYYNRLNDFSNIENFPPGDKNVLDHDTSVEYIAGFLMECIYLYSNDEEEDDLDIDESNLLNTLIKFCIIQSSIKERWINDIDSFVTEIQNEPEDEISEDTDKNFFFYHDYIRYHSLNLIQISYKFSDICGRIVDLIQENESNLDLASQIQEAYYYILFSFITDSRELIEDSEFDILPPVDSDDLLLYGEYVRCTSMLGIPLTDEEYTQILDTDTHFIPKIMLSQGIAENKGNEFPNELILNCIECLIQMIELFQTNADIDIYRIIGKLVLKSKMDMNDYSQFILMLKDQWIKYMNDINRIISINNIISYFLKLPETIPILIDTFIPLLLQLYSSEELKEQSLLLFILLTKKLPIKSDSDDIEDQIQISESSMNAMTNDIYSEVIIPTTEFLINENDDLNLLESFLSITAFYCRIEIIDPLFLQLIIFSIDKLNDLDDDTFSLIDDFESFGKHFISFVYEYLLVQSDEDIGKTEIIHKMIESLTISKNNDKYKASKNNLLLLILALFCTENYEYAIPIFNSVDDFYDIIFPLIFDNLFDFQIEERAIYIIMYLLCTSSNHQLYDEEIINQFNESINDYCFIDSCVFFDRDDPFICNNRFVGISKEAFLNHVHFLMSQINN